MLNASYAMRFAGMQPTCDCPTRPDHHCPFGGSRMSHRIDDNGDVDIKTSQYDIKYDNASRTMTITDRVTGDTCCSVGGDPHIYDKNGKMVGTCSPTVEIHLGDTTIAAETTEGGPPTYINGITVQSPGEGTYGVANLGPGQHPHNAVNLPPGFYYPPTQDPGEARQNVYVRDGKIENRDGSLVTQQTIDAGQGHVDPRDGIANWLERRGIDFIPGLDCSPEERRCGNRERYERLEEIIERMLMSGLGCPPFSMPAWQRHVDEEGIEKLLYTLLHFGMQGGQGAEPDAGDSGFGDSAFGA